MWIDIQTLDDVLALAHFQLAPSFDWSKLVGSWERLTVEHFLEQDCSGSSDELEKRHLHYTQVPSSWWTAYFESLKLLFVWEYLRKLKEDQIVVSRFEKQDSWPGWFHNFLEIQSLAEMKTSSYLE